MSATRPSTDRSYASNALANVAGWSVSALAGFICVPFVVRGLGADGYGLLALVTAFSGYLGLMEMGLSTAVVRYIAYYRELGQGRTVRAITRVATGWFAGAGVVGAVLLFNLAPWLVRSVLKVPVDLQDTAVTVARLSSLNFFLGMLISVPSAVLPAFLRYDIVGLMTAAVGTVASIGPAVLVSAGYGLVAVVIFQICLNFAALAVLIFFVSRLYRDVEADLGPPWRDVRRQVLSFAGITALTRIHGTISWQTNRVVVGIAAGTSSAAYYQVPGILSQNMTAMLSRLAEVLFPTGSRLFASDDHERVRALYLRTSRIFFLLNASVTMSVCVFAYPLMRYWLSAEFASEGRVALIFFAITAMLHATTMSASNLNSAAARPKVNLFFSLMSSIINLAAVYPLTVRYGVPGAAAAGMLGTLNVPFFFLFTHRRILHVSSLSVLRRCYLPTVAGSAVCAAAAYFTLVPLARNLLSTLALLALTALIGAALSGGMGALSREDIAAGRRLLSRICARLGRR